MCHLDKPGLTLQSEASVFNSPCVYHSVCRLLFRYHHSADHVHHHHRGQRLHASRVLHQGRGHLPLGQLRLCLPLGDRVRGCELPLNCAGEEREEAEGESKLFLFVGFFSVSCLL